MLLAWYTLQSLIRESLGRALGPPPSYINHACPLFFTKHLDRFSPFILSCSVACFKLHKESSSCEKKPLPTPNEEPDSNPQSLIYVDPEDDEESIVPREALQRLGVFWCQQNLGNNLMGHTVFPLKWNADVFQHCFETSDCDLYTSSVVEFWEWTILIHIIGPKGSCFQLKS